MWGGQSSTNKTQDIESIMPEKCINKITDLQETKFLRLFGLTNVHYQCSYAQM
jgi:hypothetical protein